MEFFKNYVSNTLAGSASQSHFDTDGVMTGRVYYKLFCGGDYEYSLLFSNITDSTFSDGSRSVCNDLGGSWEIVDARVGICTSCGMNDPQEPKQFIRLTFSGVNNKHVVPGELFASDPVMFEAAEGEYLCIELTFTGDRVVCHPELQVAAFISENGKWIPSQKLPVPSMVGCRRAVKRRIGFLGDSITQGIGSTNNSYLHWNARVADMLGQENAYHNLGIGYARCADAATDGVWLNKAKQNDIVVVCLGVNDLLRGYDGVTLTENLRKVVKALKAAGVKVILQSIPPFDYKDEIKENGAVALNVYCV
ncbi:MAG: SGNH/GDSL hydrolase family protein [Clostridia bacterium]|nr:SGNH/GDSL hydrolase family protein [Clostridia bacterium]